MIYFSLTFSLTESFINMKRRIIEFEAHAMHRALQRGARFGLDYFETEARARLVARNAVKSRQRKSKNMAYYRYFQDGLAFYVICKEREFPEAIYVRIITVIIERGRE
jgi:hypothetical protein